MATATLLPRLHPPLFPGHKHFPTKPNSSASFDMRHKPNPRIPPSSAISATFSSSRDHEEQLWLREEQRWIREEQRWLREELRWSAERETLLREIASLRLRVQNLERESSSLPASVDAVFMTEKECGLLTEAEPFRVEDDGMKGGEMEERRTLRIGSEGKDVWEMQEALLRLGFFCGEDDMEFSSFSSGTERAVKTWQASLGVTENGIMTAELLEKLFVEQSLGDFKGSADQRENSTPVERNVDGVNGAAVTSVSKIVEREETVIKEADDAESKTFQHRVFLLGENRWEEPSRLQLDKPVESNQAAARNQCLACCGEGRVICTECDGSGEPNVEPQFLEWIGERANCMYCDGVGSITCDVCDGKSIIQN